jgi:hypothetical protein
VKARDTLIATLTPVPNPTRPIPRSLAVIEATVDLEDCNNDQNNDKKNDRVIYTAPFVNSIMYSVLLKNARQSAEEQEVFTYSLFQNTEYNAEYDNSAYFVAFRQSTQSDKMIKSFVAVLSPAENGLGFFSYVHILVGATNQIVKTSRGFISHLPPATYFVGVTWRPEYKDPRNYEIIAFERDTFNSARWLLYGMTMGSAAVNQPIIARTVLLRIGDRRSLGRKLTHSDIDPTEFKVDEIDSVIENLMKAVPDGFKHINPKKLDDLATVIKEGIQNVGSGALQTHGFEGRE